MKIKIVLSIAVVMILTGLAGVVAQGGETTKDEAPADISRLPPLQIGDWVLRMGRGRESMIIRGMSGGDYSHIGVLVRVAPELTVIHAVTDESGQKRDRVMLTPLDEFLSPSRASAFAVIRPLFLSAQQKHRVAQALLRRLDEPFVLAPRRLPHLYCTTLIEREIKASHPEFRPHWRKVDFPGFRGEYLFPEAFASYPGTRLIVSGSPKNQTH